MVGRNLAIAAMRLACFQEMFGPAAHHDAANRSMAVQDAMDGQIGRPVGFDLGKILRKRIALQLAGAAAR